LLVYPAFAQVYSNNSMITAAPSPIPTNGTTAGNPIYRGWKYNGCVTSKEGFPGFTPINIVAVNVEKCTVACIGYKYAALLEKCVIFNLVT
jgi:hypothetical protein